MRFFAYTTLALLFSVLVNNALQAQELPCDNIQDPLVTAGTPSLFGGEDFCCGQNFEYKVCYDLESYFSPPSLEPHCGGLRLLGFEYPGGTYTGNQQVLSPAALANALNSILINAGLPDLATFEANLSNLLICADGLSSNEFSHITIKCFQDTIQILPTIDSINTCPVSMEVLENAYEGIMNGTNYTPGLELFNLTNTGANAGATGSSVTADIINGASWDNANQENALDPTLLPSLNEIGHLLNAVFASGVMSSPCGLEGGENINCRFQQMLQQPVPLLSMDELNQLNSLLGESSEPIDMADVTAGLEGWLNDLDLAGSSPAGYINSIFGWNLPDGECPTGGEGDFQGETDAGKKTKSMSQGGAKSGVSSNPDEDFFSHDIPGIGAEAVSPPTPSAMAMMQAVSAGVDLYNGAQSANIPLHTLQAYDITVPVSISTTNNGLLVDAIPGSAGQHWNINAGGQVTRTVKGLPDEFNGTIESAGVGQQVIYTPRWELPSTVGFAVTFPACPSFRGTDKEIIRNGLKLPFSNELGQVGDLGPVRLDISWSGFQPDKIHIVLTIPAFSLFGLATVSIQVGMQIGYGQSTFLMPVEYRERAVGYSHIDETGPMGNLGLSPLTEQLLENPSLLEDNKVKILNTIHPRRKRDDAAVVSNLAGSWAAIRTTFDAMLDGRVTHETRRLDMDPDEYNFTAGAYSGKFFIKPNKQVFLTPYQPGVQIIPSFTTEGELTRFEVRTPDGFIYTFGQYGDHNYVDRTQDMTYMLPNFYAYPEKNKNRELFGQAQIDVSIMERFPFINGTTSQTPYGNTYDRNYKITNGPEYTSAWHLASIRSIKTLEEVTFEYVKREGLSYFSSKSYTHTFPDFGVKEPDPDPLAITKYNDQHNPLHLIETRWENGRAEFTYTATQTTQSRWDLTDIVGNRGESMEFLYQAAKEEIPGDVACSEIRVIRNESLYRGWKLLYQYPNAFETPPVPVCTPAPDIDGGSPPLSIKGETTFSLGDLYTPVRTEYNGYFFILFSVCSYTLPIRINVPSTFNPPTKIPHRNAVSELGSLIEVRTLANTNTYALADFFGQATTFPWLDYDADQMVEMLKAEGKRTFLRAIKEIDQSGNVVEDEAPFVSVAYHTRQGLPKRFSTDQDQYGYPSDNSISGSPFPSFSYTSTLNSSSVSSADEEMAVHYGFSNASITPPNDEAHKMYMGKPEPKWEEASKGSIIHLVLASGAKIQYEYELNVIPVIDATDGTVHEKPGAGIRVKKKIEDPGDTPAKTTHYFYKLPAVNTLPVHVSKNEKDIYYKNLERKVVVSSHPQNMMLPNGSSLTGYGKVTEEWNGIGKTDHYFTTPANFTGPILDILLDSDYDLNYECFREEKLSLTSSIISSDAECTLEVQASPAVFMPGILRQFNFLFGLEVRTQTFSAGQGGQSSTLVLEQENNYRLVVDPDRRGYIGGDGEKMKLFNSSMYQYNDYGNFWGMMARRQIIQLSTYALNVIGVDGFITDLINLIFNETPFAGRTIEREFETVHYDYPSIQIVLDNSKTTETYLAGGTSAATTTFHYLTEASREVLLDHQEVVYSDNNKVKTFYYYAFQEGTAGAPLLEWHDKVALNYLKARDYLQPLASETKVNGTTTQANLTALTMTGGRIVPFANYGLQNGVFKFLGKFVDVYIAQNDDGTPGNDQHYPLDYNADGKPNKYWRAKFRAGINPVILTSDASDFFEPVEMTWYPYLNIPLKTRKYLEFETTNGFSVFHEFASNTDINGVTTGYQYDNRARLATVSKLNGHQVTDYTYTIGANINAILMETQYGTGEVMNLDQKIDGFGKEKTLIRLNDNAILNEKMYDDFWRVKAEDNIGTGMVDYEYEASPLSKLLNTKDEVNNIFSYVYKGYTTPYFKTVIVTDPNSSVNESNYNALEQLKRTYNDNEASEVTYDYDNLLRLSEITNPIQEKFTYDYNAMGLLWRTTVPGRGPQSVWYDKKFRPVVSSDGNNHYILTEYDDFDRPEKTYLYESGFSVSGSGGLIEDEEDLTSHFTADKLLSAVTYIADNKTWVKYTENRLLEDVTPAMPVMVTSDNTLDDIGRVIESITQYPDNRAVTTTLSHSSVGYLLGSDREIVYNSSITENVSDVFEYDNVLRPHTHKVFYGTGQWVFANRMEYDNEDRLITKWVGGLPMEDDRFLQEVNYAYDPIGRLVRINNPGTFLCNIEEEVCAFSLELNFPLLWENCDVVSAIKINGQTYPLTPALNLMTQQDDIAPAIEAALAAYGLDGEASTNFEDGSETQTLTIGVVDSRATELSLILGACEQEVAFTPNCCTIPPVNPVPPIPRSEDDPEVCTADLYHQVMRYNGLDIQHISIGSGCGFKMSNNYEYDGLHRITEMNNVLFGPTPHPDAFSTTYNYDAAGNIRQLTRRGLIGMGAINTLQSDIIDQLNYTYAGNSGVSSVLASVEDVASNPVAQPLGVNAPMSGYGHDGNGNMT